MKKIRNKIFETNSSSSHSVSINKNIKEKTWDVSSIEVFIHNGKRTVIIDPNDIGEDGKEYNDAKTKLNYIFRWIYDRNKEIIQKWYNLEHNINKSFDQNDDVINVTEIYYILEKYLKVEKLLIPWQYASLRGNSDGYPLTWFCSFQEKERLKEINLNECSPHDITQFIFDMRYSIAWRYGPPHCNDY